jgi:HK97 family phage portal protein
MISLLNLRRPARSIENPSTSLADPDAWLVEAMGGGKTDAGVMINAEKALTYSPLWRAISLVAKDVAGLPLYVYRRVGEGKERDRGHPSYRILRHKSSAEMVSFQLKLALQLDAMLRGNGYAWIRRRGDGTPQELMRLNPAATEAERTDTGQLVYLTKVNNEEFMLRPRNVLHIKGLGDGITGMSLIQYARESIGLGLAARSYGAKFFSNDGRPSIVLEHPAALSPKAKEGIRRSWEAIHAGLDNAHRPAVLEEGMKVHPFSMTNEDAQFLGTRQFEVREVSNWTGVPAHKLGDPERTSYNSLEQEEQAYLDNAVNPWLLTWEAEGWDKMLREREKRDDTHIIEFVREAILRVNLEQRYEGYVKMVTNGIMSRKTPLNLRIGDEEPLEEEPAQESTPEDGSPPEEDQEQERSIEEVIEAFVIKREEREIQSWTRLERWGGMVKAGIMTVDEARAKEGLPPVEKDDAPPGTAENETGGEDDVVEERTLEQVIEDFMVRRDAREELSWDRLERWGAMVKVGLMTPNEARAKEGLPAVDGGDELIMPPPPPAPTNGTKPPEVPEGHPETSPGLDEAARELATDYLERMTRRVVTNAKRWAKKPDRFLAWVEDMMEQGHRDVVEARGRHVLAVLAELGVTTTPGEMADVFLRQMNFHLAGACDCQPADLERSVEKACEAMEQVVPASIMRRLLETHPG